MNSQLAKASLLFQLLWFILVLGQTSWLIISAIGLAAFVLLYPPSHYRLWLLLALVGSGLDWLFISNGLLDVGSPLLPIWLLLLWLAFANYAQKMILSLPFSVTTFTLLGLVFGPLSYYGAAKLTDVSVPHPELYYPVMVVCWGGIMGGYTWIIRKYSPSSSQQQ